jgi:hypothetical protein
LRCELQKDLRLNSKPDKIKDCQKYGVTGLIPDPSNPSSDPSPAPSVSPQISPSASPLKLPKASSTPLPTSTLPTNSGSEPSMSSDNMGNTDWLTTSQALNALRDEIVKDYLSEKDKQKVEDEIAKILTSGVAVYQFKDGKDNGKNNSEMWIKGIQSFQNKTVNYSYNVSGSIIVNDSTYNLLKCEVANKLNITLNDPPYECPLP